MRLVVLLLLLGPGTASARTVRVPYRSCRDGVPPRYARLRAPDVLCDVDHHRDGFCTFRFHCPLCVYSGCKVACGSDVNTVLAIRAGHRRVIGTRPGLVLRCYR